MADFPENLLIELVRAHDGSFSARSEHVNNPVVSLHGPRPLVVDTYGRGQTPVKAITKLLDNISKGESS